MKSSLLRAALLFPACAALFLLAAGTAHPAYGYNGYVDPGAGLLILQSVGSVLVGFLFVVRRKIAKLFGIGPKHTDTAAEPGNESAPE